MCAHRHSYVFVPTVVASHLVMIKAHITLALRETHLHRPVDGGYSDKLGQRSIFGTTAGIYSELCEIGYAPLHKNTAFPTGLRRIDIRAEPVIDFLVHAAGARADSLPSVFWQRLQYTMLPKPDPKVFFPENRHHMLLADTLQIHSDIPVTPIYAVTCRPCKRKVGIVRGPDHIQSHLRLRSKLLI